MPLILPVSLVLLLAAGPAVPATAVRGTTESSAIDLGKKRLGVSGEIANVVEFQIEAELKPDDPWRDVYAEYKQFDLVRVRGGQFKIPFSLDENTGASRLDFMFRSLAATHLAPGRD